MQRLNAKCTRHLFLPVVVVWVALYAWRPWLFGFYSDDYILFLSPNVPFDLLSEQIVYYWDVYQSRPLSGLFALLLYNICKDSVWLWQCVLALQVLAMVLLFSKILLRINCLGGCVSNRVCSLLPCVWLALPITFGFTAWITMACHNFAILFYLLSFVFAMSDSRQSPALALGFYLLSCFTHEAFYFQFIVILGIVFFFRKQLKFSHSRLTVLTVGYGSIQILAVIFNRVIMAAESGKSFQLEFILTRIQGVLENPQYWYMAIIPMLVCILFGFLGFYLLWRFKTQRQLPSPSIWIILLGLSGSIVTVLIYFSMGYSIRPFGLGSRTTVVFSFWLILMLLGLLSLLNSNRLNHLSLAGVFLLCVVASVGQSRHWAQSWHLQKAVIDKIPTDKFHAIEDGSLIVVVVPNFVQDVIVFEDDWTFGPAAQYKDPTLKEKRHIYMPHKNTGFRAAEIELREGILEQRFLRSGHQNKNLHVNQIYIWNYYTDRLYRVTGSLRLPEGLDPLTFDFISCREV